jgi:hypothetical protein
MSDVKIIHGDYQECEFGDLKRSDYFLDGPHLCCKVNNRQAFSFTNALIVDFEDNMIIKPVTPVIDVRPI